LELFGHRLRHFPAEAVRAVGTNTLRRAHNTTEFLERARGALGHNIEIIAGREEARLIYLGVAHELDRPGRRLVVDIGGGSTEVIAGEGEEPLKLDSLYMGCVSWSLRYFPGGLISREAMKRAITAARLELSTVARDYRELGWQVAIGSSGTINAIERVLVDNNLTEEGLTLKALKRLRQHLLDAGSMDKVELKGLSAERREVLPGGLAILMAVMDELTIPRLIPTPAALREGLLYDLLGRIRHDDIRTRTIEETAARFRCDATQAFRVRNTALSLFGQVSGAWQLTEAHRELLRWAAQVHELGLFVSYSGHHKHGAYILSHADLAGFSRQEQAMLACLVLAHRGQLSEARMTAVYPERRPALLRLAVLLRLAAHLHRARVDLQLEPLRARAEGQRLYLDFPEGWLEQHPLTRADLAEEVEALRQVQQELYYS
jgi:exopolyphosphatase/guanosine-5'-triphosphate,3'-diphosphate pyrophosphatase